MNEVRPWLIDVPVQFNIWIRPECQRKQWDVIKQVCPKTLFVVSDGGRNEEEWALIRQNRAMIDEELDWDCDVHKLYSDQNYGMYQNQMNANAYIWERVDRCIFMEDDVVPAITFFSFCKELLEKYKDDTRICMIAGLNFLGDYDRPEADYFFSTQPHVWGFATWKRVYQNYYDFSYGKQSYTMDLLRHETASRPAFRKKIEAYAENDYYQGHKAFEEFFLEFAVFGYHQLAIIPKQNMICNIGASSDSTHFTDLSNLPKEVQNLFHMKTYDCTFPLHHPSYFIPDYYYDNRVHEINADSGLPKLKRQIERKVLYLKSGKSLTDGIKKVVQRTTANHKEYEK